MYVQFIEPKVEALQYLCESTETEHNNSPVLAIYALVLDVFAPMLRSHPMLCRAANSLIPNRFLISNSNLFLIAQLLNTIKHNMCSSLQMIFGHCTVICIAVHNEC